MNLAFSGVLKIALMLVTQTGLAAVLGWALLLVGGFACLLAATVVTGRRLHDLGLSAGNVVWLVPLQGFAFQAWMGGPLTEPLVYLVAFVALLHLWLSLWPGTRGANPYGYRRA